MILLIVDLWQHCVRCKRSGVTRCTLFMVHYLCLMCQCGLHSVLWSHIGILQRLLAAEPRSTTGSLFLLSVPVERSSGPCIRWCSTGGFQEHGQCCFIGLSCSFPFSLLLFFPFSWLEQNVQPAATNAHSKP